MSGPPHTPTHDYLITHAQLTRATRLQAHGGGVVGPVHSTLPIRRAPSFLEEITPPLVAAIDALCDGGLSAAKHVLHFRTLHRRETRATDILDPAGEPQLTSCVVGLVVIEVDGRRSPPLEFSIDESGGAILDDAAANVARTWIAQPAGDDVDAVTQVDADAQEHADTGSPAENQDEASPIDAPAAA